MIYITAESRDGALYLITSDGYLLDSGIWI
jgi:hypothetical protein